MFTYTIAEQDFDEAIGCLEDCARHLANTPEYGALVFKAVILYARPFSTNEKLEDSGAIAKLKLQWFPDLSQEEKQLHKKLIKLRNKTLAHAEGSEYPVSLDHESGVIGSRRAQFPPMGFKPDSVRALLSKLSDQCDKKRADYSISERNSFI